MANPTRSPNLASDSAPANTQATVPTVSLIMPIGGAADGLEYCLASVARLDPQPLEILIILDGARAEHQRVVEHHLPDAQLLLIEKQSGPAVCRNRGAATSTGDLLLFLDADVQPNSRIVEQVATLFHQRPDLHAAMGSYDDAPAGTSFLSQYRNLLHHFIHQESHDEASTFWSGCGVLRREAFAETGGYNESFEEPSVEDIELGMRLRRANLSIALVKSLQVKHLKRWRVRNMLRTDLWMRAVPWTELMLREGHLLDDLNVKTRYRWAVVASYLLLLAPLVAGTGAAAGLMLGRPAVTETSLALALLQALCGVLGVLITGHDLYRFLFRRRGLWFTVQSIFWHWVYHVVCGLGFVLGWTRVRLGPSQ